jgi:hypothetical protein
MLTKGANGYIDIGNEFLTIKRKGAAGRLTRALRGDKPMAIDSITGVEFKEPGPATYGSIQFTSADRQGTGWWGLLGWWGLFGAGRGEGSLMFKRNQADDFAVIRDRVEGYIDTRA